MKGTILGLGKVLFLAYCIEDASRISAESWIYFSQFQVKVTDRAREYSHLWEKLNASENIIIHQEMCYSS